jgi:hypothetical protein
MYKKINIDKDKVEKRTTTMIYKHGNVRNSK